MTKPPTGNSAHVDRFVRDHLPPPESWPDLLYDVPGLDYAPQTNVAAELVDRNVAEGRGERVAVETDDTRMTYRELRDRSSRIAGVLVDELGLVPGGRVLLRAPNNPMMVACWMAVARAGGVVVATMPLLRSRELAVIADKARVDLALCDDRLLEEMNGALELSGALKRVVPFQEIDGLAEGKSPDREPVATAIDDPVLIAFTSGTTGAPKGCVHFHRDVLASADAFFRHAFSCDENDVFAGSPPLAFTFGLGMLAVFPFRVGARTALVERPSPEALLTLVSEHRVSVLATAPTAYRAMLPLLSDYDTSSLRYCVSAGETLPRPTGDAWHEATGLRLVDGLGATELFHIFVTAVGDDVRPGATGKPVTGYEAKVFDDEMREVPPGDRRQARRARPHGLPLPGRPAPDGLRPRRLELHRRRLSRRRRRLLLVRGAGGRHDHLRGLQHRRT